VVHEPLRRGVAILGIAIRTPGMMASGRLGTRPIKATVKATGARTVYPEVRALEADRSDRQEMLEVAAMIESVRAPR
jgi:hypothetical protein